MEAEPERSNWRQPISFEVLEQLKIGGTEYGTSVNYNAQNLLQIKLFTVWKQFASTFMLTRFCTVDFPSIKNPSKQY